MIRYTEENRPAGAKTIAEIAKDLQYGKETVRSTMVNVVKASRIGILNSANLYSAKDVIEASGILIKKSRHASHTRKSRKPRVDQIADQAIEQVALVTEPEQPELPLADKHNIALLTLADALNNLATAIRERSL